MNDDPITLHIDSAEVREGVLDHQIENCPTCGTLLVEGFGLAGGGFGAYGYCPKCERIIWKCTMEE